MSRLPTAMLAGILVLHPRIMEYKWWWWNSSLNSLLYIWRLVREATRSRNPILCWKL